LMLHYRMTGGGFGGSTVTLVNADAVDSVIQVCIVLSPPLCLDLTIPCSCLVACLQFLKAEYRKATGIDASFIVSRASAGARVEQL
jgi:galactokinase